MKLSEVKSFLENRDTLSFELPDGSFVPGHFHVTEIGKINKHFIDCGGTIRKEEVVSFQLWNANDYDHRLHPGKLLDIIKLAENQLGLKDQEVEVEYQAETIGKYGLAISGNVLRLTVKQTDCLAKDNCGIPAEQLAEEKSSCCPPGGSCC